MPVVLRIEPIDSCASLKSLRLVLFRRIPMVRKAKGKKQSLFVLLVFSVADYNRVVIRHQIKQTR